MSRAELVEESECILRTPLPRARLLQQNINRHTRKTAPAIVHRARLQPLSLDGTFSDARKPVIKEERQARGC